MSSILSCVEKFIYQVTGIANTPGEILSPGFYYQVEDQFFGPFGSKELARTSLQTHED